MLVMSTRFLRFVVLSDLGPCEDLRMVSMLRCGSSLTLDYNGNVRLAMAPPRRCAADPIRTGSTSSASGLSLLRRSSWTGGPSPSSACRAITCPCIRASSSVGRASASQAEGRGSESRLALRNRPWTTGCRLQAVGRRLKAPASGLQPAQFGAAISSRSASRRTRRQSGSPGTAATALRYMRTASPIRPWRRRRSP
jgi:hypothetical protein